MCLRYYFLVLLPCALLRAVVDFVTFAFDSLAIAQKSATIGWGPSVTFMAPFTRTVWLGLFGLVLLQVIMASLDTRINDEASSGPGAPATIAADVVPDATSSRTGRRGRLGNFVLKGRFARRARTSFFNTFFTMMHNITDEDERGMRPMACLRVLSIVGIFFGIFFLTVYEAGLLLVLFQGQPSSDYRGIIDVKNCRIPASSVCIANDGDTSAYWAGAIEPKRDRCRDRGMKDEPTVIAPGSEGEDMFSVALARTAAAQDPCEFFLGPTVMLRASIANENCGKLTVLEKGFSPRSFGFILPLGSNLTEGLNRAVLGLMKQDKIPNGVQFGGGGICNLAPGNQLTWSQLSLFFYVSYGSLVAMWVFMVLSREKVPQAQ